LSKSIPNVDKMMPSVEIEKYEGENRWKKQWKKRKNHFLMFLEMEKLRKKTF
jgi:hypothetical protein